MRELEVYLNHFQKKHLVGVLAQKGRTLFFQYGPEFLRHRISISPYTLPLDAKLKEFKNTNYGDIFGAFADSLADGWGLLLMDRKLRSLGYDYQGITSFDRLNYMGNWAMGALEYLPVNRLFDQGDENRIDLYQMAKDALTVYSGKSEEVISKLFKAGGSPGGARPKIVVVEKKDGTFATDTIEIEEGDTHWLIKFDVSKDFEDFSSVEYFYSLMAIECGIRMMPTYLFTDKHRNNYFGIQRFDRQGRNKIHTHSFGSLIESNFRTPEQDYKSLMLVAFDLTKNIEDLYFIFRQMVFNVFSTNQDDHVKNFSFVMDEKFRWHYAPAYDLTPAYGMNGWHATTVNGKGTDITEADFLKATIGTGLDLKRCGDIINEVKEGINSFRNQSDLLIKSDRKKIWKSYISI